MQWLYAIPAWQLALVVLVALSLSIELGHRFGRKLLEGKASDGLASLQGAVIGVVGLLLAFSFALASSRYEQRKSLIVAEANAIGTAYLRTELMPQPTAARMQAGVRDYLAQRIAHYEAPFGESSEPHARAAAATAGELWRLLAEVARTKPDGVALLLMAPALNEMFDVGAARDAAYANRVPVDVLLLLFVAILLCGFLLGYRPGATRRSLMMWSIFALLVTLVFYTLLDLDRPRRGLIRIDQRPMKALFEQLSRSR